MSETHTTELATIPQASAMMLMPAYSIEEAIERRNQLTRFVKAIMVPGADFGEIPGTGRDGNAGKNTLLKPGAEKLVSFFGLTPKFEVTADEDWTGVRNLGEPRLSYISKCQLWHGDRLIGEGNGACNSWESKYRYRNAERRCPNCDAPAIKKSKFPPRGAPQGTQPGFYCFDKIGGCGVEFAANDSRITGQSLAKVPNPDIADVQNTLIKMADKRALIAACLIGVNASEFFTQDMDDVVDAEFRDERPAQAHNAPAAHRQAPASRQAAKVDVDNVHSLRDEIFNTLAPAKFGPEDQGGYERFVAFIGGAGIETVADLDAITSAVKIKAIISDLKVLPDYAEQVSA